MLSKFKMLSTTADSSRTIDELKGDTAVWRRCFAPDARAAGGATLRGQTAVAWRGLGLRDEEKRTRYAPLRGYVRVLADYTAVHQQQQSVTK